ncbi:MAG TPA: hydrogen gas-evolving membrane-bound hydrogenase subunit E [Longimicrobiales bacterium]|nr:hydrogen gas-evolving membrane-bound hydrogenase subunit E [Longimicrobiales bacterium]
MIVYAAEILTILLAVSALALVFTRDLFAVVVLLSVYSGLLAGAFAAMGAVDVAFMEAVVGTSMSTVFLLSLMWWIDPQEATRYALGRRLLTLVPTLGLGGVLVYGINALPAFGDPNAPAMRHISPVYAQQSVADMATPNVVAAVLADYRSLDTLMEAAVVVAAVLACLLILMHRDDPVV